MTDDDNDNDNEDETTNVLDTVKHINEISSKGWASDLLGPMAKVFGKAMGDWAESVVRKRATNLESHVDAVVSKNPALIVPEEPKAASNLQDWIAGASEAAPDSDEGAIWRSILEDIMHGGYGNERNLIELARKLDQGNLDTLKHIRYGEKTNDLSFEYLQKLGLAKRSTNYFAVSGFALIAALTFYLINVIGILYFVDNISNNPFELFFGSPVLVFSGSIFAALFSWNALYWVYWRSSSVIIPSKSKRSFELLAPDFAVLTPSGEELLTRIDRYSNLSTAL